MAPGSASKSARAPTTTAANSTAILRSPASQVAQHVAVPAPMSAQSATSNATTSTNANQHVHSTAQLVPVSITGSGSDSSPVGMGESQPESDDALQPIPGQPYKDGRIRNPVPSKLKGKTSNASGRFSVMHMDIRAGKDVAADRDAAAKRTSENTALAAKMAYESGYQPHRKSNWLKVPEDSTTPDPTVPFTGTTPYNHALYGLPKPVVAPPKDKPAPPPARALTATECKEEQARLLTLLRSLQPVAVVDQICKALAYFGGVPEAPPPQDGKFPESAEANGPGSVFVGWIAEIFPDLDSQGRRKTRPPRAPDPPPVPTTEKRGRGRPKGSKASKFRSDKGVKKGPKRNALIDGVDVNGNEHEDSWVDVDETVMDDSHDVIITGATDAPARYIAEPQPTAEVHEQEQAQAQTQTQTQAQESAKKRGRPKGSKNRPKDPTSIPVPDLSVPPNPPAPISALFSIGKKAGGKAKGAKNRQKDTPTTNGALPTSMPAVNGAAAVDSIQTQSATSSQAAPVANMHQQEGNEFHLSALKAYNESQAVEPGIQASSFQPVNTSTVPAQPAQPIYLPNTAKTQPKKRKRNAQDNESASQIAPAGPSASNGIINTTLPPAVNHTSVAPVAATAAPSQPTPPAPPAPPAPKRQKKSKAKAKTAAATAQVQEQLSAAAPTSTDQPHTMMPAAISQLSEPQMYTSPTIEELEAQLEQHDQSSLRNTNVTPAQGNRSAQQAQMPQAQMQQAQIEQPTPHMGLSQAPIPNSQVSLPKQVQQAQQKADHRAMARQRQQQAVARTASPNVNNMRTVSPHVGAQSASPNINPAQTASPNLQQQRTSNSQTPTSMGAQMQSQHARNPQSYYTQQSTSTQSPYAQQQSQQYTTAQPSPPPAKQQFNVPQSQQQQQQHSYNPTQQSSQNPTYTSQQQQQPPQSQPQQQQQAQSQPQYSQAKQQTYSTQPQQQYASPVQQYSAQQRVQQQQQQQQQQQYATTSAATTTQSLTAQSPQYGTSNTSGYSSIDGHFRTNSAASMGFNSYGSSQTSTAPRSNNLYSTSTANSYGPSSQQISSYATGSRRNLPTTTPNHSAVHNVQSIPQNLGFSSDFGNLGFDNNLMSGLDNSAGSHNSMGLNTAQYNVGTGNVSRSSGTANNFTSLNNFDSTMRNDGYNFGLRR